MSQNSKKWIRGIVLLLVLLSATYNALVQEEASPFPKKDFEKTISYEVIKVIDGDTIIVKINQADVIVRLIGVDTPETVHPQKAVEAYGQEASRFTTNLLKGERVYLEYDMLELLSAMRKQGI